MAVARQLRPEVTGSAEVASEAVFEGREVAVAAVVAVTENAAAAEADGRETPRRDQPVREERS